MLNGDESVSPINEEQEMKNMQDLYEVIEMFLEKAKNDDLSSAESGTKVKNDVACIDILVMLFDGRA